MGNCISANQQKEKDNLEESNADVSVYVKQEVIKRDGAPMSNKVKKIKKKDPEFATIPEEPKDPPPPDPSQSVVKADDSTTYAPPGLKSNNFSFNKKKLNKADYMFDKKEFEFCKKLPGEINGLMFKITNCKESNIYIHDNHDTASVLNCEDCTIIMGPNSNSVFVRDCKNCKMVITAKQLRVRDCHGLRISLYTQTEPVIESSTGITIIPHQYVYEEMFYQMRVAKLSFWNNKYTEVYDFTPSETKTPNHVLEVDPRPYK